MQRPVTALAPYLPRVPGGWKTISADPAWSFNDKGHRGAPDQRLGEDEVRHYRTMLLEDIVNMPVPQIAAPDAILPLWVPSALLSEGLIVMRCWGFRLNTSLIWVKTTRPAVDLTPLLQRIEATLASYAGAGDLGASRDAGEIRRLLRSQRRAVLMPTLAFGMGHLFRGAHEVCLIGVRHGAKLPKVRSRSERTVFFAPARAHSEKPEEMQTIIERVAPGPRLELFARRYRAGWTVWGDGLPFDNDRAESATEAA